MSARTIAAKALVLFDIDGTLMRGAGPHHKEALLEGIQRVTGIACSFDGIDTSGQLDRDLIHLLLEPHWSRRRVARSLQQIMYESQASYERDCSIDLRPRVLPGVRAALTRLQERNIPLALVTGNLTAIGWRKLDLADLRSFFRLGAFAEQGTTRARLAQVAAWQARRLGLTTRDCTVSLIGDHANDIAAAKANGFRAVAVATGMMPFADLVRHQPDVVLNDMTELSVDTLLKPHPKHPPDQ